LRLGRQPRTGRGLSASKLGTRAVIVMPTTTPQVKVDAVRGFGGEVVLFGDSYSDAYGHSLDLQKKGLTFVHPFDDPDVIAGQGTIAMEMLLRHKAAKAGQKAGQKQPAGRVFVAIGGGGLIAGVANYIKAVRPEIKVIGVQMNDSTP
jgi:threonine dehydratase